MLTAQAQITANDLLVMHDDGWRYELVKGELRRMPPAGFEHGNTTNHLSFLLTRHVIEHRLGTILAAETGFLIRSDPDTVRAPDIAFIRQERLPAGRSPKGYWRGSPDLAVEVISPNDTYGDVEDKVQDWLDCGTLMVIVVNPRNRTVTVHRPSGDVNVLRSNDELTCGDLLPGFSCRVSEIFA